MPIIESCSVDPKISSAIGLIIPPPELRNIIDKTANFVARNGKQFEEKIHEKEANNKKFNFLKPSCPYHSYYLTKLNELCDGEESKIQQVTKSIQNKQQEILKKLKSEKFVPGKPPKEYEFIADPPILCPINLDTVKLTAQFVARNGRRFLTELMNREQKNPEFDFLRPQHALFPYFARLLEQYTKILIPPKDLLPNLKAELEEDYKEKLLKDIKYHANWLKYEEDQKRIKDEKIEQERIAYNTIDWHEFFVVETISYYIDEPGNFPPPITPEMIGSRLINEMREEKANDCSDIEMQMDDSDDEEICIKKTSEPVDVSNEKTVSDFRSEPITIKKYDPKETQKASKSNEQYLISPFTGEKIEASKIEEHMRISLLDPRWIEQREQLKERLKEDPVYATGTTVCSNLKQLAERRTDIFGEGDKETEIGKKIGEEDQQRDNRMIWDGHSSSLEATSRAIQKNISTIVQNKPVKNVPEFKQPFPIVQNIRPQMNVPPRGPPLKMSQVSYRMVPPFPPMRPIIPAIIPSPPVLPFIPAPNVPFHAIPQPMDICDEDPPNKKSCPENRLIPEDEFLKTAKGPIQLKIQVPSVAEKSEKWKLNGQLLTVEVNLTDTINMLKQKVQEQIEMPVTKQKLAVDGIFLKDSNSIAFYNLTDNLLVNLQVKERGGRKK